MHLPAGRQALHAHCPAPAACPPGAQRCTWLPESPAARRRGRACCAHMRRGSACVVHAAAAVASRPASALRMPALPFVKIADQEDLKLALMLNVVDPTVGGVLIMGDRGTGKSVAVRAPAAGARPSCKGLSSGLRLGSAPGRPGVCVCGCATHQARARFACSPASTCRAGVALAKKQAAQPAQGLPGPP